MIGPLWVGGLARRPPSSAFQGPGERDLPEDGDAKLLGSRGLVYLCSENSIEPRPQRSWGGPVN